MTDRLDLPDRYRRQLEALLAEHVPDAEAWAYGSRVNGRSHPASDLDLVLRGPGLERIPASQLAELEEAIEQSNIPILIQTHDWARLPTSFHKEIEQQYVVLRGVEVVSTSSTIESSWTEARWGDLVTLEYGRSLRNYRHESGDYRVFGTNGPIGSHNEPLCHHPTVVIGRKGANRGIHYSPDPCFVIDTAFYLKPKANIDTRWAYYQLLTVDINGMDSGSAIPSTSRESFYQLPVSVPPIHEQQKIARILGTLDDRIELNQRMSETLEEMARALFRSWFVDFDPVRAKADGRPSGLPLDLDALFPAAFKESELGEIPTDWTVLPAGEAVTVRGGSTPSTREPTYWGDEHHFATPKDLSLLQQPILMSTARQLTDEGIGRITSGLLPEGTVLLSSRAPIGYLAMTGRPVAINQGIIALTCGGLVGATYALHWAQASIDAIKTRGSGTTFAEISKSSFRDIPFLVPQASAHAAWESLVIPLYDRVASLTRQQLALVGQRDALLPLLLSGKLRVGGARPVRAPA